MISTGTQRVDLGGLPALLQILGAHPSPDDVAAAVAVGPGGPLGAHASLVLVVDGDRLRPVGAWGALPGDLAGTGDLPLAAGHSACTAVREAEPVVSDSASPPGAPAVGSRVSVPVVAGGVPIGAMVLVGDAVRTWSPRDLELLGAVADAVALWMAHPATGLLAAEAPGREISRLTERQCAILAMVATGRSTEAIGAALGYSPSTVKQDLRRAMQALGTTTREAAAARARELRLCRIEEGAP